MGNFETCGKLGDSVSDANQSVNQEDDRKQRESKLRLPVACGTNSGYQKHIRDGTTPCVPCKMAHTENARKYSGSTPYTSAIPKPCTVEGCDGIVIALGFCEKHYRKNRKYGDPLASLDLPAEPDGSVQFPAAAEAAS